MTSQIVVATANVLRTLRARQAAAALQGVLSYEPDFVGLQEWEINRLRLTRVTGSVALISPLELRLKRRGGIRRPNYVWSLPVIGGCAVGARTDRFDLLSCTSRLLSPVGRADKPDRPFGIEPARLVTVAVYFDRHRASRVTLFNYHLAPGVQAHGAYRDDRPILVQRHQREVRILEGLIAQHQGLGHDVYAVGDSNFDGLRLAGVTSAWLGRETHRGTHGETRKIDDVHGPGPATSVTLLDNASDHKALIVTREG